MLLDIVIALVITAIAVALGITVHPVLFALIVLAIIWFFARRRAGGRRTAL